MAELSYRPFQATDYKSAQAVRWCPGCGDHFLLNSLHKAMANIGIPPHQIAVISGIGCSSRLPYYMNTYGFHTIHGRGAAIASGVKVANPKLCVWQITGDGDCLAIGGNHFIHSIRRNIDLNIVLVNNQVYGLTKGQYSPTSPKGYTCKSAPYGTIEDPFRPAELTFGARGTFFARTVDVDAPVAIDVLTAAANHKGASVVEVLENCVIFNDGTHSIVAKKDGRAKNSIVVEHGKPMIFGENKEKGIVLEGLNLKVVVLGENGITEKDLLVHDESSVDNTIHQKLANMAYPEFPIALGVIRRVAAPSYNEELTKQIEVVKAKNKTRTLQEYLMQGEIWEVK